MSRSSSPGSCLLSWAPSSPASASLDPSKSKGSATEPPRSHSIGFATPLRRLTATSTISRADTCAPTCAPARKLNTLNGLPWKMTTSTASIARSYSPPALEVTQTGAGTTKITIGWLATQSTMRPLRTALGTSRTSRSAASTSSVRKRQPDKRPTTTPPSTTTCRMRT